MLGGAIIFLTAPPNHATKGYRNGAPRHNWRNQDEHAVFEIQRLRKRNLLG